MFIFFFLSYERLHREYLSKEEMKTMRTIPVVLSIGGLLHKQSRIELEQIGIQLNWKQLIRTMIINNTIDVLAYISNHLSASDETNLKDSEDEQDSLSESSLESEDSEDNKCDESNTIVID